MLAASRPDFITDIDIGYSTITITKGHGAVPANFNIADHYLLWVSTLAPGYNVEFACRSNFKLE